LLGVLKSRSYLLSAAQMKTNLWGWPGCTNP
jgi:hypothetical protein